MAKKHVKNKAKVGASAPPAGNGEAAADNNKVGYGRPPRHTRFKKGQCGNPRGCPRGGANAKTIAVA